MESFEYVVLDLETTGLYQNEGDKIIEIGALLIQNGHVADIFSTLINPRRNIPPEATFVNGITKEMTMGKPTSRKAIPALCRFIGERPIFAHNATFDSKFLLNEMNQISENSRVNMICSLLLARRIFPNFNSYTLENLSNELKLDCSSFHEAISDCEATWKLLETVFREIHKEMPDFLLSPNSLQSIIKKQPKQFRENGLYDTLGSINIINQKNDYLPIHFPYKGKFDEIDHREPRLKVESKKERSYSNYSHPKEAQQYTREIKTNISFSDLFSGLVKFSGAILSVFIVLVLAILRQR